MTARIDVSQRSDGDFDVEVRVASGTWEYVVSVPADLPGVLGHDAIDHAELVRMSFEFLLQREPATSILNRFSLGVIPRYFPEYPSEMAKRLS